MYPRQCGVVLCVSVSNNGRAEQSSESYLGNVNPIHTLIFNGKSQAATLPGLPAWRWTQCTQLHPDLSRYARFSYYIILYHCVLLVWEMRMRDLRCQPCKCKCCHGKVCEACRSDHCRCDQQHADIADMSPPPWAAPGHETAPLR